MSTFATLSAKAVSPLTAPFRPFVDTAARSPSRPYFADC